MAECPCTNISIMQLFHELKQQFPAVPDQVVTQCIRQNFHDKRACEAVLSKENQTYSFPGGRVCKMAAGRPDTLQLEDTVWDHLTGQQSLDNFRDSVSRACTRHYPNNTNEPQSVDQCLREFSQLSMEDECRRRRAYVRRGCTSAGETASAGQAERTKACTHSAPVTPSNYPAPSFSPQRHCTKVDLDPTPLYQEPLRPFTSVNLTLRPPSSEPQPPIDISSGLGGLTYSSCSYDPRQGYQSRLQISIAAGGRGSVTAARTVAPQRPPLRSTTSLPDVTSASDMMNRLPPTTKELVREQLKRKDRLAHELHKYKERLHAMQREVTDMTADWQERMKMLSHSFKAKRLRDGIMLLQKECNQMAQEVYYNAEIRHVNTETLPLGETNEEFYKHIYRGQLFPRHRPAVTGAAPLVSEGQNWTCHVCTFHNHPALNKCEQCDMPRIVTGAETQNIHIHVTHHNVPSSPYRRVVHSWVV